MLEVYREAKVAHKRSGAFFRNNDSAEALLLETPRKIPEIFRDAVNDNTNPHENHESGREDVNGNDSDRRDQSGR